MEKIDFELPEELIAQHPLERRDRCRLLHLHRAGDTLEEHAFTDLTSLLKSGDLLVLNDTKVARARLYGVGGQAGRKIEMFLVDKLKDDEWVCLVRPGKKAHVGDKFYFSAREYAEIVAILADGSRHVRFHGASADDLMERFGRMPLPPYIKREDTPVDRRMYQTVYAQEGFSIAAPTAGLHFTEELLEDLQTQGVEVARIRLDVGRGTFKPIEAKHYEKHVMDAEEFWISDAAAKQVNDALKANRRIVAVGSTVVRTLEGCYRSNGKIVGTHDETDIFIFPPFEFKVVSAMITNFHLPQSSLLAMVAAFTSPEQILRAYGYAIDNRYRFYSYGDAMLIT